MLYHVKHSIVQSQIAENCPDFEQNGKPVDDLDAQRAIYQESAKFMPFLRSAEFAGFNKTIRMVYQNSDDARITELNTYPELKNYFSVFSGKVTTCIQVALDIKQQLEGKQGAKRLKI